jgi:hypothetical protein
MKKMIVSLEKIILTFVLVFAVAALVSAQTKTEVKVGDLQKNITDQITKDYAGYTIKDAFKVVKNKIVNYEVNINKEKNNVCLAFDESGKFLKVVEPKLMHAALTTTNKTKVPVTTTSTSKTNSTVKK